MRSLAEGWTHDAQVTAVMLEHLDRHLVVQEHRKPLRALLKPEQKASPNAQVEFATAWQPAQPLPLEVAAVSVQRQREVYAALELDHPLWNPLQDHLVPVAFADREVLDDPCLEAVAAALATLPGEEALKAKVGAR